MVKKRQSGPSVMVARTSSPSNAVYQGFVIKDELSGESFLVDTGALASVFAASLDDRSDRSLNPSNTASLIAANGSRIKTYGSRTIALSFNGHKYSWRFIVADVNRSLLGADFLSANNLLVDTSNRRLLDSETLQALSVHIVPTDTADVISCVSSPFALLAKEFPGVFKPELKQSIGKAAKHGVPSHKDNRSSYTPEVSPINT